MGVNRRPTTVLVCNAPPIPTRVRLQLDPVDATAPARVLRVLALAAEAREALATHLLGGQQGISIEDESHYLR